VLTAGQRHEQVALEALLDQGAVRRQGRGRRCLRPRRVAGDKGYSSRSARHLKPSADPAKEWASLWPAQAGLRETPAGTAARPVPNGSADTTEGSAGTQIQRAQANRVPLAADPIGRPAL
jgi:hypothetical protein